MMLNRLDGAVVVIYNTHTYMCARILRVHNDSQSHLSRILLCRIRFVAGVTGGSQFELFFILFTKKSTQFFNLPTNSKLFFNFQVFLNLGNNRYVIDLSAIVYNLTVCEDFKTKFILKCYTHGLGT